MSDLLPCRCCGKDGECLSRSADPLAPRMTTRYVIRCMCGHWESPEMWNKDRHINPATKASIEADVLRRVAEKKYPEGTMAAGHGVFPHVWRRRLIDEADRILKEANK